MLAYFEIDNAIFIKIDDFYGSEFFLQLTVAVLTPINSDNFPIINFPVIYSLYWTKIIICIWL